MTELLNDLDTPSDAELISRVRGGDVAAYGVLFSRHREAATRLARQLVRGPDADDLTSEAFAKVLGVLQRGGGPDVSFRAYLLTAVRRLHVDRVRSEKRLQTTDDLTPFDPGVPFHDTSVAAFENGAAAKAFASLPERWQLVLWHLEVEGQKPADIAPLLGMSANSVSALAYRAREGLRQAFLTMHLSDISETECRWVNEHLGAFVRNGLSKRDTTRVQSHLDECRRCTAMYLELNEVNSNLSAIIAPLLLGTAATGYLASIKGTGGALGALSLVGRVRELAAANTGGVAAGAVAVGVATAAALTFALTQAGGDKPNIVADPPAASVSTPAAPLQSPSATTTRSATPTATPSPSRTPSSSARSTTLSPSSTPTTTLSALPSLSLPPAGPTGRPSGRPSGQSSGRPSPSTPGAPSPSNPGAPSPSSPGAPSPSSPGTPSPSTPGAPVPAARTVDPPAGSDDGTMTVTAHDLRAGDTLAVTMVSLDTTFAAGPPDGCRVVLEKLVQCDLTAAAEDFTVTLQLDYPPDMVADQIQVTAAVVGVPDATASALWTFRPARLPSFDFLAPVLGADPVHRVQGDVDLYDFTTTAVLPRRVQGLVYQLGAGAGFRAADVDAGCTVTEPSTVLGPSTMTCPDVGNGDRVAVPLQTESLSTAEEVGLSVRPVVRFDDPQPDNRTTLSLRPGVDLSLTGSVSDPGSAPRPAPDDHVVVTSLGGRLREMSRVDFNLDGAASFVCPPVPACSADDKTLTVDRPAAGPVTLPVRLDDPLAATAVTIEVRPGAPYVEVDRSDNTISTRLAPDIALDSAAVVGHRLVNRQAVIRARISGAPSTLAEVRIGLSGGPVTAGVVSLADGADGANGEGGVDCFSSDADGTATDAGRFATCTGVRTARDGRFFVDLRLTHPHGVDSPVILTVQGVGADEDGGTANNSQDVVVR